MYKNIYYCLENIIFALKIELPTLKKVLRVHALVEKYMEMLIMFVD